MTEAMIRADALSMTFGPINALHEVSIEVRQGSVTSLLGHNGAGKTTLINILATLLQPTAGQASVAGFDVVRQAAEVRRRIGLTGQYATVDEHLSGRANLVLIARLLGFSTRQAQDRAEELLTLFDLSGAADRTSRTYSGGMRRRLDLAAALIGQPDVLFLDEPTTGLDPVSRLGLWDVIEGLVHEGTAVLLTTQYLNEADRLADQVTVLAEGRVVATGTASELKAGVGSQTVLVTVPETDRIAALDVLQRCGLEPLTDEDGHQVRIPVDGSVGLARVVRALDEAGLEINELELTRPTLDDVYLALTRGTAAAIPA